MYKVSRALWILQTQELRTSQEKEPYIRVNIRELDEVPNTGLSILYMLDYWSVLYYY